MKEHDDVKYLSMIHDVKYLSMMGIQVPTGSGSIEVIGNAMRDVMGRPSWYGHEPKSLPGLNRDKHYSLRIHMGSDRARPNCLGDSDEGSLIGTLMIGGVKTHVLSDTGATHRFCKSKNWSERNQVVLFNTRLSSVGTFCHETRYNHHWIRGRIHLKWGRLAASPSRVLDTGPRRFDRNETAFVQIKRIDHEQGGMSEMIRMDHEKTQSMSINGSKDLDGLNRMRRTSWESCTIAGRCRRVARSAKQSSIKCRLARSKLFGPGPDYGRAIWSPQGGYWPVGYCGRAMGLGYQFGLGFDMPRYCWTCLDVSGNLQDPTGSGIKAIRHDPVHGEYGFSHMRQWLIEATEANRKTYSWREIGAKGQGSKGAERLDQKGTSLQRLRVAKGHELPKVVRYQRMQVTKRYEIPRVASIKRYEDQKLRDWLRVMTKCMDVLENVGAVFGLGEPNKVVIETEAKEGKAGGAEEMGEKLSVENENDWDKDDGSQEGKSADGLGEDGRDVDESDSQVGDSEDADITGVASKMAVLDVSDTSDEGRTARDEPIEQEGELAAVLLAKDQYIRPAIVPTADANLKVGCFTCKMHINASGYDLDNEFFIDLATPCKWVSSTHMDVLADYVGRLHAEDLRGNRAMLVAPWFSAHLQVKERSFKVARHKTRIATDLKLTKFLTMEGKKWGVDVDTLYAPMIWGGDHWVGLCMRLATWDILPVAAILPYLAKKVCPPHAVGDHQLAPFHVERVAGLYENRRSGDCGPLAIKFLEMHATGNEQPTMAGLTDDLCWGQKRLRRS
uniref:Ubiquitin-like protease family profile domain-containing protein n=1 Tax=Brassica oleracea var. oleracea TaxID=109376 RepID=A0A0D3CWS4_BRAOL